VTTESVNESLGKWELQLRKGLLTFAVLRELSREQHYGYSLIAALSKVLQADMAEGTIYPLLSRLQRDGMIDSHWQIQPSGPARKYYRITDDGTVLLARMQAHWLHVNQRLGGTKS